MIIRVIGKQQLECVLNEEELEEYGISPDMIETIIKTKDDELKNEFTNALMKISSSAIKQYEKETNTPFISKEDADMVTKVEARNTRNNELIVNIKAMKDPRILNQKDEFAVDRTPTNFLDALNNGEIKEHEALSPEDMEALKDFPLPPFLDACLKALGVPKEKFIKDALEHNDLDIYDDYEDEDEDDDEGWEDTDTYKEEPRLEKNTPIQKSKPLSPYKVIAFKSLDEVLSIVKVIPITALENSSLYKNSDNRYLLCLKANVNNKDACIYLNNVLNEYCVGNNNDNVPMMAYIQEHCQAIIENNAIQKLNFN